MEPVQPATGSADLPPSYPRELERTVVLGDGRKVHLRPIRPSDATQLQEEIARLDDDTLYRRFMTPHPKLDAEQIRYLTTIDYQWRLAIGVRDEHGRGVALARYEGAPEQPEAEVAVVVRPEWRRLGIASMLFDLLAVQARQRGIKRLTAYYLAENHPAAKLLKKCGYRLVGIEAGVGEVVKDLE